MPETAMLYGLNDEHVNEYAEGVLLNPALFNDLRALIEKAALQGFDLKIASGFRGFDRQLAIWNAKALGQRPLLGEHGEQLDVDSLSEIQRVYSILRWSALPGASRHHWGSDFDIYDAAALGQHPLQLTVEETEPGGVFYPFYLWLESELKHSDVFYRPYCRDLGGVAREPWHLSYKPLSQRCISLIREDELRHVIVNSDMQLKETVLAHLNEIFERFVVNVCD